MVNNCGIPAFIKFIKFKLSLDDILEKYIALRFYDFLTFWWKPQLQPTRNPPSTYILFIHFYPEAQLVGGVSPPPLQCTGKNKEAHSLDSSNNPPSLTELTPRKNHLWRAICRPAACFMPLTNIPPPPRKRASQLRPCFHLYNGIIHS